MKFLIQNYISVDDTQPFYFHTHINNDTENESVLWNSDSQSLYDIFDHVNPDYFITHAYRLSKDFSTYVSENTSNVKLLLNINNLHQNIVNSLEDAVLEQKIDCPFFFCNNHNIKTKKIRLVYINSAFDTNLLQQKNNLKFSIDKAFFIYDKSDISEYDGTYHFISNLKELEKIVDIALPEISLFPFYQNYNEIIFHLTTPYLPQSFFDAIANGNKVYYTNSSVNIDENVKRIFKITQSLNYNDENRLQDFTKLKAYIAEKHTGLNRTKTLLSQI